MVDQPDIMLDINTSGKIHNPDTGESKFIGGLLLTYYSEKIPYLFARCTNPYTGEQYLRTLIPGAVARIDIHYLCPWRIELFNEKGILTNFQLNYKNQVVAIEFASGALGDTLAWLPIVNNWVEKNEIQKALVYTKWNFLFDHTKYPRIQFVNNPSHFLQVPNLRFYHRLGHALDHDRATNKRINHANPVNWKETNMFDSQNYSLGLPSQEIKPFLKQLPPERIIQGKYVTICNESSQKIKHILNPQVWLALVYKLKELGYQVVNVGNKCPILPEVINAHGMPFENTMRLVRDAEFHVGLSSGLSWLAWAYGKKVLMLSNFTHPGYEFSTNVVRVINQSTEWGIFNDSDVPWEARWEYDPFNDNIQSARRLCTSHALRALEILLSRLNIENAQGIYVNDKGIIKAIEKLQPKELPKYLTKD